MPRYKLILEYDGAPFVGWQRQENGLSVQEVLEGALTAMTGARATAHGAGRTDAGVRASWPVTFCPIAKVGIARKNKKTRTRLRVSLRVHGSAM